MVFTLTQHRYLGTQLGDDRSISQVAKRFMGTGMLPEPEPRTTAPANAPVGRVVGAGPPPPPLLGFRKAARTPPLSTAAAIITSTACWGAALAKCRTDAGAAELCAACSSYSSRLPASPHGLEMLIGGAGHVATDRGQHHPAFKVGHLYYYHSLKTTFNSIQYYCY